MIGGRSLSDFTVELDVYSGPYEWLLALILKDEVEIFEVPLQELVDLYLKTRVTDGVDNLDRDTDFAGSAAALVLLKSRTLAPAQEPALEDDAEEILSPEQLVERLQQYLKIRRGAETLGERFEANRGFYASAQGLSPRPGKLSLKAIRIEQATRRVFSRIIEPPVEHLGPITITLQELVAVIRASLARGPISYEELTRDMNRLRSAVTFAAVLSLAGDGSIRLSQPEPFGPLTLEPGS